MQVLELAGHRTLDAETADYFLVPAWIYGIRCVGVAAMNPAALLRVVTLLQVLAVPLSVWLHNAEMRVTQHCAVWLALEHQLQPRQTDRAGCSMLCLHRSDASQHLA